MLDLPVIRWILTDKTTGKWVASVFADRYARASESDPMHTYHFWRMGAVVASVDQTSGVNVSESGRLASKLGADGDA